MHRCKIKRRGQKTCGAEGSTKLKNKKTPFPIITWRKEFFICLHYLAADLPSIAVSDSSDLSDLSDYSHLPIPTCSTNYLFALPSQRRGWGRLLSSQRRVEGGYQTVRVGKIDLFCVKLHQFGDCFLANRAKFGVVIGAHTAIGIGTINAVHTITSWFVSTNLPLFFLGIGFI